MVAFVAPARCAPQVDLASGSHAANDEAFHYAGDWRAGDIETSRKGTPGAKVQFSFTGTQFRLSRAYGPDEGKVRVCVDKNCEIVDGWVFLRIEDPQPWAKSFAAVSDHEVSIEVVEGKFTLFSVLVISASEVFHAGTYDSGHPGLMLNGSWLRQMREGPFHSTILTSADPLATVSFQFLGSGIAIGTLLYDDRDKVELCVDDACRDYSLYASGLKWQEPILVAGLKEGLHKAVLRKLRGKAFDIDSLTVIGARAPIGAGFHRADDASISNWGIWDLTEAGVLQSRSTNATIVIPFSGRTIVWHFVANENGGLVEGCLDAHCRVIDTFSMRPIADAAATFEIDPHVPDHVLILRKKTGRYLSAKSYEVR